MPASFFSMEITLEQLLQSRDNRYARQCALVREYPDKTLVCLTVVLPGSVKRDARSLKVAEAAVETVLEVLHPQVHELYDLETGYEGYFIIDGSPEDVKRSCCLIEDTHPYGRLMDLDVLEAEGDSVVPMSRERVGQEPRRCLVCDRPARECMRAHTHDYGEIVQIIDKILSKGKKS